VDTNCSFCGRERNQITVRHPIKLKDGQFVVNEIDLLYLLLKLSRRDYKWKIVDNERVLVGDTPSMTRLEFESYKICESCWRTAAETIPQMLVKRFSNF